MADTLESLEIEVKHSASGADGEINKLASSIGNLKEALNGTPNALKSLNTAIKGVKDAFKDATIGQIDKLAESINNLNQTTGMLGEGNQQLYLLANSMQILSSVKISQKQFENVASGILTIAKLAENMDDGAISNVERMCTALQKLSGVDLKGVSSAMRSTSSKGSGGQTEFKNLFDYIRIGTQYTVQVAKLAMSELDSIFQKTFGRLGSVAKRGIGAVSKAFGALKDRIKENLKPLSTLLHSLGRIAFYRIIRGVIKAITQAFKEGLENAYAFSNGIEGEGHRFAEAMDSMKTASSSMKNQLGSAFISLLAAIAPIINAIISLITKLADAIAQLFAAFTGSTYLKAADVPKKWADAAGGAGKAAKEWKNQLLGFDEINRLNEPNQGGGGGGGGIDDPSSMFEDSPIKESIKKFVDDFKALINAGDWKGAGELLGNKINELLPTPEQWKAWGAKLGYGLNGAIQTLYYTLKTIDFYGIGERIANFLNGALEQIDFTYLGAILVRKITLAVDFLLGLLGNLDWGLVGKSIFDFLMGAIREATEWLQSKDWEQIGKDIYDKFKELIDNIDFAELAKSFFTLLGIAFGALVSVLDGFFSDIVQGVKDYFKGKFEECGGDVWEGFKKGIVDAAKGIYDWVKTNMVDPFVNAVKGLLGIHSPSTVFEEIGTSIVDGLQGGFSGAFDGFLGTVETLFGGLISWCQDAHNWIQDVLDGIGLIGNGGIGGFIGGLFGGVQKKASGGFVDEGQLFIAREAGAEMVGTIGGHTAVANNDQIVEGIRQGVFEAVMAANSNGNNDVSVKVYLDSREIRTGQNRINRAMGVG